jgi:sugar (pentulose or hexulose) kinase
MNPRPDGALLAIDCGTPSVRAIVFNAGADQLSYGRAGPGEMQACK